MIKSLGVMLDQCLSFDSHADAVVRACNYHMRAIKHVRNLMTQSTALTLACSLINSRLDYCNALLNGAPASTIRKLQRAQSNAACVVLGVDRYADWISVLRTLHWLPLRQRIVFKTAVLTLKTQKTKTPDYPKCHLIPRATGRATCSATLPLLVIL